VCFRNIAKYYCRAGMKIAEENCRRKLQKETANENKEVLIKRE
jgi:hypothetical protein